MNAYKDLLEISTEDAVNTLRKFLAEYEVAAENKSRFPFLSQEVWDSFTKLSVWAQQYEKERAKQ